MSATGMWQADIDHGYNANLRPWVVRRVRNGSWQLHASAKSPWPPRRYATQEAAQKVADKLNAGPQP